MPGILPSIKHTLVYPITEFNYGTYMQYVPGIRPCILYGLPSGLFVSSFCWSINWRYHRHIIGLILPANSSLVPSRLGLRPERMFAFRFIFFLSFLFLLSFRPL